MKTPVCFDAKIDKKRPIDNKSNWQEGQGKKRRAKLEGFALELVRKHEFP